MYFYKLVFLLFMSLFTVTLLAAAEPLSLKPSANKDGLWGVADAAGKTIIPFKYSYLENMQDGYLQVGLPSKTSQRSPNHYGVVNSQGKTILNIQYDGIDYLDEIKRFKVVTTNAKGQEKFGIFDTNGKNVVPVIYDYLERISNMGDEPTNMVKLAGKTGYINIVTGEVLIKPIFDELIITGKNTNAQGVGLAVAQKSEKWGVLATNGKIIVPFDYNFIGELSTSEGKAIAVKSNQLLQLNFNNNQFINATEVSTVYSSNFVPRLTQKTVAKPYDGFYVAKDYPNMKAAFDGWQTGKLSWVAQPSFQVKNDEVFVSFGIFRHVNLPLLSNVMSLNRQVDGFTLVDNFDSKFTNNEKTNEKNSKNNNNKTNNILSFSVIRDGLKCNECEKLGLPVFWQLTQPKPAQTFGGIGVAISKMFADSDIVDVKDVIIDGPAYIAGLRANDSIVAIDGVSVAANSIDQVREKLRGSEDSAVKVKYIRGGRAYVVNITRKVIKQN